MFRLSWNVFWLSPEHVPVDAIHVLIDPEHVPVDPDGGCAAILDLVQRLGLIGNISVFSMRRPAKLGRNRSSHPGYIKDFSKYKMAAVPPFWI